jgi:heme/copper-type cytochrome/quinol oxidase subunit 2
VAIFAGVLLLAMGTAAWLLRPQSSPTDTGQTLTVTMAGFRPAELEIPAGQPATVRLINPDSSFHTDGGGVHQFASPELGVDVKVQPESEAVVEIPASKPGTYTFYCDVCCGGKENPSMRGTVVVS